MFIIVLCPRVINKVSTCVLELPAGYDFHIAMKHGPNQNRWFTVLNSMVDLSTSQTVSHNQVG